MRLSLLSRLVIALMSLAGGISQAQPTNASPAPVAASEAPLPPIKSSAHYEFSAGTGAAVESETTGNTTIGNDATSDTQINLHAALGLFLGDGHLEPTVQLNVISISGSSGHVGLTPTVGLKYNFSTDTKNSFLIGARAGITNLTFHSHDTQYTLFVAQGFVGKRFALTDNISWEPEISLYYRDGGSAVGENNHTYYLGTYQDFAITPFQFTLLF